MSTASLRKSCRICLLEGEVDLWTHKVKLPASGSGKDCVDDTPEDEISAHEILFEMYDERTEHVLDREIAAELPLICYRCLAELVSCFRFYRKVRQANAKIKTLYREALKLETELGGEEQVEFLDEYNEEDKQEQIAEVVDVLNVVEEESEKCDDKIVVISDNLKSTEVVVPPPQNLKVLNNENVKALPIVEISSRRETDIVSKLPLTLKRRIIKNPKFILTGGVTKILTNFNKSATFEAPQKRQRTQPAQPPLKNASLVVTQFIPSTLQLNPSAATMEQSGDGAQAHALPPTNELRTMDYAAVEIMGAQVGNINEEDNIPLPPETEASGAKFSPDSAIMQHDGVGDEQPASVQRLIYVCQYCPSAFSASHYLITHVRKSHVCKYCTRAFNKNTELYDHIRQEHRQHKCAVCAKILSSHSNLRSHIKRMHGIQLPAQVALLDYRLPSAGDATESASTVED